MTMLPLAAPGDDTIATVMDGNADFGLSYGAGIIIGRSKASSITAIATIHRRHPLAFMTLTDSGITKPQDFPGHSIRKLVPGSSAVAFQAVMTNLGLDPDSVKQVDVGFDLSPFLKGDLDIWPGFIINEVLTARESGYDVNLIMPDDYGVHLYGITLFTTDILVRDNPDLVLRFLRATLKGWRWAVENPEEAGRFAVKYDPTLDENLQAESMKAAGPLVHTGEDQIGWMRPKIWKDMHDILIEQGLLDESCNVEDMYTMEFLNAIYKSEP